MATPEIDQLRGILTHLRARVAAAEELRLLYEQWADSSDESVRADSEKLKQQREVEEARGSEVAGDLASLEQFAEGKLSEEERKVFMKCLETAVVWARYKAIR